MGRREAKGQRQEKARLGMRCPAGRRRAILGPPTGTFFETLFPLAKSCLEKFVT